MRPQLLQLAIRYLNNGDDAEDVVQDTLLKLWFLRDRLEDYRSVESLASVITRHLAEAAEQEWSTSTSYTM